MSERKEGVHADGAQRGAKRRRRSRPRSLLEAVRPSPKRLSDTRVLCPRLLPASPLMLEWSWKHERDRRDVNWQEEARARFKGQEGGRGWGVWWRGEGKVMRGGGVGLLTPHPHGGDSGHFAHEYICSDASTPNPPPPPFPKAMST